MRRKFDNASHMGLVSLILCGTFCIAQGFAIIFVLQIFCDTSPIRMHRVVFTVPLQYFFIFAIKPVLQNFAMAVLQFG